MAGPPFEPSRSLTYLFVSPAISMRVASWNVAKLPSGAVWKHTVHETQGVYALQDMRSRGATEISNRDYTMVTGSAGIIFPAHLEAAKCRYHDRILAVHFPLLNAFIISAYAPQISADEEQRDDFWRNLRTAVTDTPKKATTILLGDFNAHITIAQYWRQGAPVNYSNEFFADPCHPAETNANAEELIHVMIDHGLFIINGANGSRCKSNATFVGKGNAPPRILDFIITSNPARFSAISLAGPYGSDHKLLLTRMIRDHDVRQCLKRESWELPIPTPITNADAALHKLIYEVDQLEVEQHRVIKLTRQSSIHTQQLRDGRAEYMIGCTMMRTEPNPSFLLSQIKDSTAKDRQEAYREFAKNLAEALKAEAKLAYDALWPIRKPRSAIRQFVPQRVKEAMEKHFAHLLQPDNRPKPDTEFLQCWPPPPARYDKPPPGPPRTVFTDGARNRNGAGSAAVIYDLDTIRYLCASHPHPNASNNEAEAYAILLGIDNVPDPDVLVNTDSQVSIDIYQKRELHTADDFSSVNGSAVWRTITHKARTRNVSLEKVAAHAEIAPNEICDRIAKYATTIRGVFELIPPADIPDNWWTLDQADEFLATWTHVPLRAPDLLTQALPHALPTELAPTNTEIDIALSHQRTTSAPGPDELSAKALKNRKVRQSIYDLIRTIWETKSIPEAMRRALLVAIPKHAGPIGPDNARGISLLPVLTKILTRICVNRNPAPPLLCNQFGFTKARGAPQAVHCVRQIIRACQAQRAEIIVIFIDIEKAFDSVPREILKTVLIKYGYGETISDLIVALNDETMRLKFQDGSISEAELHPSVGTKQGDTFSPPEFDCILDVVERNAQLPPLLGPFSILPRMLKYADDIALFAMTKEDAQLCIDKLDIHLRKIGLRINTKKTKVMQLNAFWTSGDSHEGHERRLRKRAAHKELHPESIPTAITLDPLTLHFTSNNATLECPYPGCSYVAASSRRKSPIELLIAHISSRKRHGYNQRPKKHLTSTLPVNEAVQTSQFPLPWSQAVTAPGVAPPPIIKLGDAQLESVTSFKYLGSIITSSGSLTMELDSRKAAAMTAMRQLPMELWRAMNDESRRTLFRALVEPCLFYAAETWTPTAQETRRIESIYNDILHKITGKMRQRLQDGSWTQRPPIEDILRSHKLPTATDLLVQARLRLYGQLERISPNHPLRTWVAFTLRHKPHRGFPKTPWIDMVAEDLRSLGLTQASASDPLAWKKETKAKPVM